MRVKQIISKSRDGNRMEVIGKDIDSERTLHIRKDNDSLISVWRYFVGIDRQDHKVFLPIVV